MDTPILDYVRDQLMAARGTWPKVAAESGVSRRTLEKIARAETRNPSFANVEKLHRYFRGQEAA